jgi:hypothetical protein
METKVITNNYWQDIDTRLEKLIRYGMVKLPSLDQFDLNSLAKNITSEMGAVTFKESGYSHMKFINDIELGKKLAPKLLDIAKKILNYKGDISNQYHIARKVEPGNSKEMYRAHFDSHIFTLVLPIKIPNSANDSECGELIYFPNARKNPKNEVINFIDKIYFKKYASKKGLDKIIKGHQIKVDNFKDYQPLLFFGKTTLHTNYPVSPNCSSYRLTLLAHFFDDSPKYGIGSLLRYFRNR